MKEKNGQYTGLCIDILRKLAADLKFTFEIQERTDRIYGVQLANGEWVGMIKDLIDGVIIKLFLSLHHMHMNDDCF